MKEKIFSAIIFMFLLFFNANAQQAYYYYHGDKISLSVDSLVRFVATDPDMGEEKKMQLFSKLEAHALKHELFSSCYVFIVDPAKEDAFDREIDRHDDLILFQTPGYKMRDSVLLFPSRSITIKLKDENNLIQLFDSLQIGYKTISKDTYIKNRYQVELYQDDAIDVTARLFETGLFVYATPSFISRYTTTGYFDNPNFFQQWSVLNDSINMNLLSAWNISTGSNRIKTALIDDGVDLTHPDLSSNLLPGFCTIPDPYEPCNGSFKYPVEYHGTWCAGVIAAANNTMGMVGVAHTAKLIPVKTTYDFPVGREKTRNDYMYYSQGGGYIVSDYLEDAFRRACYESNADVISFSLDYQSLSDALEDVITDVCCNGRDGKGLTVVVNTGDYNAYNNSSSMSAIAKHPYVISVGAISNTGTRMSYPEFDESCYGDSLDVVAPGKNIPTTNIYDSYTNYSGTSAAAPHVAGLAALILSVNPCLTREEVKYIIESTCTKVRSDIYDYDSNPEHPNGTWNIEVGYGLVNAGAALALVQQMGSYTYVNDTLISADTLWSTNRLINQDLVIDSLVTLTITDTVYIASTSRIIVRPGGKLVLDGGTLTSACADEMWQGIYVEGHRNQPQTAANQGTVQLINGAVVENAHCAITTAIPPLCGGTPTQTDLLSTGGIITADNATFRNCAKAVEYLSYAGTNYAGLVVDNKGSFTGCTFTVDDNNLFAANGTDLLAHVSLWDVKGVEFTNCRFEDARTGNHSRKSAISALDAGFEMKTGCSYNVPRPECDCPPALSTHSTFAGFGTAIDAGTSGSPYGIVIDGARFSDNITGVRIEGSSHATVTRCTFDLSEMPVRVVTGLNLEGCTGYLVEENTFTRGASAPNGSRYGIRVNNSGTDANGLYRNTFERLSHGMYVTGTNGDGNSNTGLQMTCNEFTDNTYDMYLYSTAIVSSWQGDNSKGADNTFSGTQTSSLHNAGSQPLTYLYSAGTSHVPYNPTTGNVTLNGTVPSNNCASTLCSNGGGTPNPKSPTPSFLALKQQYENLMADFDRNGYADLLSTAIPPQAEPPASPGELAAAQYASQQMNAIASELFAQSHEAVRALMSDTLEDLRAVVAWLDATPGLASRYLAAETEFSMTGSNLSLADIANYITTSEERDEYDNYLAFNTLKQALAEGGHVMWPNATDAHMGELIRIADANTGRSSLLAKNVLCFFFGICYDDTETRALETTTIPPTAESPTLTGQQNITVHPNPTNDVLHVTVTDGNAKIARVEMFDMFGRITMVGTQNLASPPSPEYTVDLSSLPAGLYILRVTLTDGTVRNVKVVRK